MSMWVCGGGGVFIATKKDYITSQLPEADSESEAIWAKVHPPKSKSVVLGRQSILPSTSEAVSRLRNRPVFFQPESRKFWPDSNNWRWL